MENNLGCCSQQPRYLAIQPPLEAGLPIWLGAILRLGSFAFILLEVLFLLILHGFKDHLRLFFRHLREFGLIEILLIILFFLVVFLLLIFFLLVLLLLFFFLLFLFFLFLFLLLFLFFFFLIFLLLLFLFFLQ